jgi:hypothetical protein
VATTVFAGIFCVGLVFGYLLYYSVRHTKEFNIDGLSSAIGAVGGGTVVGLLGHTENWIGPYGLGLAAGFVLYFLLALILFNKGKLPNATDIGLIVLGKKLTP